MQAFFDHLSGTLQKNFFWRFLHRSQKMQDFNSFSFSLQISGIERFFLLSFFLRRKWMAVGMSIRVVWKMKIFEFWGAHSLTYEAWHVEHSSEGIKSLSFTQFEHTPVKVLGFWMRLKTSKIGLPSFTAPYNQEHLCSNLVICYLVLDSVIFFYIFTLQEWFCAWKAIKMHHFLWRGWCLLSTKGIGANIQIIGPSDHPSSCFGHLGFKNTAFRYPCTPPVPPSLLFWASVHDWTA